MPRAPRQLWSMSTQPYVNILVRDLIRWIIKWRVATRFVFLFLNIHFVYYTENPLFDQIFEYIPVTVT